MNQPKVSVIIPVYNVEKYLRQCMDSVLNQTLKEIEVICVDDGSTDSSFEILKEYEAKDSRVIVLQQQNKFAGVARNYGMSIARGKYYVFLDSDDFFEPTLLEKQYDQCEKYSADIGFCAADRFDNKTLEFSKAPWILKEELIPENIPFNRKELAGDVFFMATACPWTKMFSADFIKKYNLTYLPIPRSNDHYFVFSAIALADRMVAIKDVLVHYRIEHGGNLQSNIPKTPLTICESLTEMKRKLDKEGVFEDVADSFEKHVFEQVNFTFGRLAGHQAAQKVFTDELKGRCFEEFEVFERLGRIPPVRVADAVKNFLSVDRAFAGKILVEYLNQNFGEKSVLQARIGADELKNLIYEFREVDEFVKIGPEVSASPKASIIIPVYNTEQYIVQCVESVISQTLEDIEIICINDGSWDNSLGVLMQLQQQDGRITVVSKKNEGQSVARNIGIELAKGEYILFVDSDDCIVADSVSELYAYAHENDLDILFFGADAFFEDESLRDRFLDWLTYYHISNDYREPKKGDELFRDLQANREFRVSPCMQLIKKSLLKQNNIEFYPGIIHEDNLFTFRAIMSANAAARVDRNFYLRRVRAGSTMTATVSFESFYGYFKCFVELMVLSQEYLCVDKEIQRRIAEYLDNIGYATVRDYLAMNPDQQSRIEEMTPIERYWFNTLFCSLQESGPADDGADLVRNSMTFKVGAAVTYIPRKLYYVYRYFRQYGLKQTVQRIKNKLFN